MYCFLFSANNIYHPPMNTTMFMTQNQASPYMGLTGQSQVIQMPGGGSMQVTLHVSNTTGYIDRTQHCNGSVAISLKVFFCIFTQQSIRKYQETYNYHLLNIKVSILHYFSI